MQLPRGAGFTTIFWIRARPAVRTALYAAHRTIVVRLREMTRPFSQRVEESVRPFYAEAHRCCLACCPFVLTCVASLNSIKEMLAYCWAQRPCKIGEIYMISIKPSCEWFI